MAKQILIAAIGIGVSKSLESTGSEVEREVKNLGRSFYGYTCDFADRRALYEFIGQVKAEHPRVDILVNNAGLSQKVGPSSLLARVSA